MTLREGLQAAGFRAARTILSLRRPSPRSNTRALHERRESLALLVLRDALPADVPALASLHVATWNDTYAPLMTGPPVTVRERQWQDAFERHENWFCYLLAHPNGSLIGFAKGIRRPHHEIPGELHKIFLDRHYQRLGLGRRLVGHVARRFLADKVRTMAAYVDPRNPSCGFFERLGGEWLREPDGHVNFSWYVWPDLSTLARLCPEGPAA